MKVGVESVDPSVHLLQSVSPESAVSGDIRSPTLAGFLDLTRFSWFGQETQ